MICVLFLFKGYIINLFLVLFCIIFICLKFEIVEKFGVEIVLLVLNNILDIVFIIILDIVFFIKSY